MKILSEYKEYMKKKGKKPFEIGRDIKHLDTHELRYVDPTTTNVVTKSIVDCIESLVKENCFPTTSKDYYTEKKIYFIESKEHTYLELKINKTIYDFVLFILESKEGLVETKEDISQANRACLICGCELDAEGYSLFVDTCDDCQLETEERLYGDAEDVLERNL
ncbi:MAG: hypothetical protein GY679_01855 [Mycoplasma sp.]|nr:hypothetical protein [Mycoplasma sp.]